jgi:hypothetical protein
MNALKAGFGVAVLAAAFAGPALAENDSGPIAGAVSPSVSSGTGLSVSSGTGIPVTPGITQSRLESHQQALVTESNTAVMGGAPAGSVVTIDRFAMPAPPSNGYLSSDYERWRRLSH